jgi:hypothetical protein
MLEEMNDNLPQADGTENETVQEQENVTAKSQSALEEIDNSNAEESEDDSVQDRHDIPMLEYDTMSKEELTEELERLVANHKVMAIKDHVEEIKKAFTSKYNDLIDEKRDEFNETNTDENASFEYHFPLKNKFDSAYNDYRTQRTNHYNQLQKNLKGNFNIRTELIEELKELVNGTEEALSIGDMFKRVNDIRERWKSAGSIPRDKYNIVWNDYHFHLERFYDLIHLDKEARDLDFKHNLEQKQLIIEKAKTLLDETDVMKGFRELQILHRVWKEEIGPVDRDQREAIWNEFSDITKQMHEKREAFFGKAKEREVENLTKKKAIIEEINAVSNEKVANHNGWQNQIKKIEALREKFFKAGRVPQEETDASWNAFKAAVRNFNATKNAFYKDIKHEQQENLNKKTELVEKANALKDNEDFKATTPIMKKIQEDWKKIGHVPRKQSDKIWKEFKDACNHYFDRMHKVRNTEDKVEIEAFDNKKTYLESLKEFELVGDHKTDLDAIKKHIETWKSFGKVPFNRRHIEGKFNKILDALFEKLSLSKKDTEMMKFNAKLDQWLENEDDRALEKEQYFIRKKIDEVQHEIFQLENNIQFISSSSKGENPFIKEVQKSIERHREDLKMWKEKQSKLRSL